MSHLRMGVVAGAFVTSGSVAQRRAASIWSAISQHYLSGSWLVEDPKPVQAGGPPIWIGGDSDAALRRAGRLGDGWIAMMNADDLTHVAPAKLAVLRDAAEGSGRDPAGIGLQARLADPHDLAGIPAQVDALRALGFGWLTVNMEMLEAAGARDADSQMEMLDRVRERVLAEVGAAAG